MRCAPLSPPLRRLRAWDGVDKSLSIHIYSWALQRENSGSMMATLLPSSKALLGTTFSTPRPDRVDSDLNPLTLRQYEPFVVFTRPHPLPVAICEPNHPGRCVCQDIVE